MILFWFRRDLRLDDNAGLYRALKAALRQGRQVQPVFIFDDEILHRLHDKSDARVTFIHEALAELSEELHARYAACLRVYQGRVSDVWQSILAEYPEAKAVYCNRDYEPYSRERDKAVAELLGARGIGFESYKDHLIFEYDEVLKADAKPYTVFTPYSRRWREKLLTRMSTHEGESLSFYLKPYPSRQYCGALRKAPPSPMPTLEQIGFRRSPIVMPSKTVAQSVIRQYEETRDYPALAQGTSKLGIHFRFGTISIRDKARKAQALSDTFLNELIWRDFYAQILAHFPQVTTAAFRPEYDGIEWRNDEDEFKAWCEGRTGYALVDAGMRQLNETGYMHNRIRMLTASFLTKHLLIDWRWGEAYFAAKLLDFDLASNNGGWQWAAGCGTDAAPYFRIFSPAAQQAKFDKDFEYVRQWVKEFGSKTYPRPIVEHDFARKRCLEVYKAALKPE